jgi:two-component sensor histidine kinase
LGLVVGELRHRVKNIITIVQAIATRTLTGDRTMDEARDIVSGRLLALGRAHDLLIRASWQGAPVKGVVKAEFEGFSERARVQGPEVILNASATQTFALALHELATNAAKYGALSSPTGRVEVSWSITDGDDGPRLGFRWIERGGPPAHAPARKGFGLTMLNEAMMSDFDRPSQMRFGADGLEYEFDAPLAVLAAKSEQDAAPASAGMGKTRLGVP